MALICLAAIAVTALVGMGWFAWLVTTKMDSMSRDFSTALSQIKKSSDEMALTLVLGYKDSPSPSEPPSIEPPPSEESKPDVSSWDDMPEHIRAHYLREQMEDSLMQTPSSTLS